MVDPHRKERVLTGRYQDEHLTTPAYSPPPEIITTPTYPDAAPVRRILARVATHRSAVAAFVATAIGLVAAIAGLAGVVSPNNQATIVVAGHAAVALVAGLTARATAGTATGVSRKVWQCFAAGLAFWFVGCLIYIAFLGLGGVPQDPAAWSQIGFLLAYLPWYRALWLMRQPVLGRSRRQRWESVVVECIALLLLAVVLGAGIWNHQLTPGQNLALLLPGVLDLLLLAGLYNAVRRTRLTLASAHGWLALAFLCFAVTDTTVTVLVPRGHFEIAGIVLVGYAVALGFVGIGATRPLRLAETRRGVGRSSSAVGLLSLALVAPATALVRLEGRIALWVVGGALLAWLWSRVAIDDGDADALTGMLRPEALQRQLSGVLSLARQDRPATFITIEMHGLGQWSERHGFQAADTLVRDIACALEDLDLPEGGVWSHTSPERFAWLGVIDDANSARLLAHRVHDTASTACSPLGVGCGVAVLPGDADAPDDVISAAQEAAAAAIRAARAVVLFDRGHLDGLPSEAGYGTGLRARRTRIVEIMESEELLEPVFQPIVDLERMEVRGYEALSRFRCEPRQTPDVWIAEAHALGLGVELEAACIRRAMARRGEAPLGRYLSLNTSPELLMSSHLDDALAGHSLEGIVLEITEHHHVSDYAQLADRLALLRGLGARVAIDDVGAGHSSMRHVMNLRPEMIKVDRWMVTDIDIDSGKRALLRSFVALSTELGADLVIEGVETSEELSSLRDLGVLMAQGYLFARPDRAFCVAVQVPDDSRQSPVAAVPAG